MCKVEGCVRPARARGWCGLHYKRWRKDGHVGPALPKRKDSRPPAECSVEGCEKPRSARGWCQGHYVRWKATGEPGPAALKVIRYNGAPCSVDGCEKVAVSLGWCKLHYGRAARTGDPGEVGARRVLTNKGKSCILDGCERPRRAKGWCEMHWQRWRATGDPGPVEAKRVARYDGQACTVEGCETEAVSGGLCNPHYLRFRKYGDPLAGNPSPSVLKVIDHPDGTRTCTACGERKPLDHFGTDKNATGGRRSKCKPCRSSHVRSWYAENQERQRNRQRARYAAEIETIRQRDKERYVRDREKRIAATYIAVDRRRARLAGVTFDRTVTRSNLRKQYGDECFYCGVLMDFKSRKHGDLRRDSLATVEHVIPISAGGDHSWENVVLACWRCNISKNKKLPEEWAALREVTAIADKGSTKPGIPPAAGNP